MASSNVQLRAAKKLKSEAKELYRKEKYSAAISKLTEAIEMRPPILLELLDIRGTMYEKLGDNDAALADAKRMIRHDKTNPTGYLRMAKVYFMMKQDDKAINVYKAGLQCVESSDPQRDRLSENLTRVLKAQADQRKAAEKDKCDPMVRLPLELVDMIMKMVPFYTLVKAQRVSKQWRTIISCNSPFWSVLDFSGARKPIKKTTIKTYLQRANRSVTRATLNRIASLENDDPILTHMARACPDLRYLTIIDGLYSMSLKNMVVVAKNLTTLVLHCEITFSCLVELIKPERNIQHLECARVREFSGRLASPWSAEECKSFLKVSLRFDASVRQNVYIGNLVRVLPNLTEFQVTNVEWPNEPVLDLSEYASMEMFACKNSSTSFLAIKLPPTLQTLDLDGTQGPFLTEPAADTCDLNTAMRHLNVSNTKLSDHGLRSLMPLESKLEKFFAASLGGIDTEGMLDVLLEGDGASELQELSLAFNYDLDDFRLRRLNSLPALKRLDLSGTRITGPGIISFIRMSKSQLEELIINQCPDISNETADFLRGKGIIVKQNLNASKMAVMKPRF